MPGWEELPMDLADAISKRLDSYDDYVRFRAVCVSWNTAAPKSPTHLLRQPVPLLMLPFDDQTQTSRSFYSILENKVYHLKLPETRGKYFRGSFKGWVVTVGNGPELHLFNLLTKAQISLPPLSSLPNVQSYRPELHGEEYALFSKNGMIEDWSNSDMHQRFIDKIVVSSIPNHPADGCMAVAIYGQFCKLAFCRSNDSKWTAAKIRWYRGGFGDVIYYQGKFWAVTGLGNLVAAPIDVWPLKFHKVRVIFPKFDGRSLKYLVGSSDDAHGPMVVERLVFQGKGPNRAFTYKTRKFKIHKMELDSSTNKLVWSEVTSLGDNMIFLGNNMSLMMSSRNFPQFKGNCVYYTDNILDFHSPEQDFGGFDIGMFDMAEGSIKEFEELNLDSQLVWPPPVWV